MADPQVTLAARVAAALPRLDPAAAGADPQVRRSQHSDYQVNAAFGLAKQLGRRPAELAAELAEALEIDDVCAEWRSPPRAS